MGPREVIPCKEGMTSIPHRPEVRLQRVQPLVNMLSQPDWLTSLKHVHPTLIGIFPISKVVSPQAGRIQKFYQNWKTLSNDSEILKIVQGWEIPLLREPVQKQPPHNISMNRKEEKATDLEVESMLAKGAIREAIPKEDQFLSNIFVTPKGEASLD